MEAINHFVKTVRKQYPNFDLRPIQRKVAEKVIQSFEDGCKVVMVDMPTGGGKSILNFVVALHFSDAYYTTPQIVLLEQLENDKFIKAYNDEYSVFSVIKGKDKYPCILFQQKDLNDKLTRVTAKQAPCNLRKFACPEKQNCPYYIARDKAIISDITAMSFAFMIHTEKHPDFSVQRELLIVDEGDDIENWMADYSEVRFKTPVKFNDIYEVYDWARKQIRRVDIEIEKLEDYVSKNVTNTGLIKRLQNLQEKRKKLEILLESNPEDYTFVQGKNMITLKAINVGNLLKRIIWSRGDKILITSGTIINPKLFSKYTGLSKLGKIKYIEVPHPFPVENRIIKVIPTGKMTKNERSKSYDKIVKTIIDIVQKHKGENGIIHAHCYEIATEITKRLKELGINVIYHDSTNRNEKFNEFIKNGGIFVSVGFERGVDLKHELCRFQIITKVPYPNVTDIRTHEIWIKRKDWKWARYQAIKQLIQAYGRSTRSKDDYSITYILDESVMNLLRYKSEIPDYFMRAIQFEPSKDSVIFTF